MQITVKEQKGLSHSFSVQVPATEIAQQQEIELVAIGKKAKVQGFRPGKVPMNELKRRYGKDVMGDVLDATVNNAVRKLVEDNKLRPALQPDVKIVSFEDGKDPDLEWVAGWGVRYQALRWSSVELLVRHREDEGLGDSTVMIRVNAALDRYR